MALTVFYLAHPHIAEEYFWRVVAWREVAPRILQHLCQKGREHHRKVGSITEEVRVRVRVCMYGHDDVHERNTPDRMHSVECILCMYGHDDVHERNTPHTGQCNRMHSIHVRHIQLLRKQAQQRPCLRHRNPKPKP